MTQFSRASERHLGVTRFRVGGSCLCYPQSYPHHVVEANVWVRKEEEEYQAKSLILNKLAQEWGYMRKLSW